MYEPNAEFNAKIYNCAYITSSTKII